MNINFSDFDFNGFYQKEGKFCGEDSILIYPQEVGVKFTQKNKIFRSSIWDKTGKLLSAGFPKFTNWGEQPEQFPVPISLDGCQFVNKLDGSLAIFDFHNGELNVRTRGTFTYKTLENKEDFEFVIKKYPKIQEWLAAHSNFSILCEILTPNKVIILRYGDEPELRLIGCVNKNDYSLLAQETLDNLSEFIEVPRPEYAVFGKIESLIEEIQKLKGLEGYCVYSDNGQIIHKIKTSQYLILHRAKSYISSFDKVLDLFFEIGRPKYTDFYQYVKDTFDYELAEYSKAHMAYSCALHRAFNSELLILESSLAKWREMSRNEAAKEIINHPMKFYIFELLNHNKIQEKHIKKWILQNYKSLA